MLIKYRLIKKSDYQSVTDIMSETWCMSEDVTDQRALNYYQGAYLYSYLSNSNYCEVALADGKVAGFLFGRCDNVHRGMKHIKNAFHYLRLKFALLFRPGGLEGLDIINKTVHVDKKLIRDHTREFDGELCLFAVDPEYRKHGIGIALLNHFHEFMRANKAENYYLYTDTYCNVGFYEENGFELVSLDTVDFGEEEDGEKPPKYMLYKYDLEKRA